MWLKWLPWRFILRKVARQQGFIDPVSMLSQFQNFAQPSVVMAPKELLREGVVLHARGLINSQAIQHNLDWVWPYWVQRQFNPKDISFVPRAFSLTQINLTHRNWTAVGVPDFAEFPIVDPRGLLTPYYDGWSLDSWIITEGEHSLIPSRLTDVSQKLLMDENLAVLTRAESGPLALITKAEVVTQEALYYCQLSVTGLSRVLGQKAWLVISLRPFNPEGVSFIHHIDLLEGQRGWRVNQKSEIYLDQPADRQELSYYRRGDVFGRLLAGEGKQAIHCRVGLATAAALFQLEPEVPRDVVVRIPFRKAGQTRQGSFSQASVLWRESLADHCRMKIPDDRFQFLYDAAVRTLILHSPDEVYPGPYTYRRFWFRDAAFILYAMLCLGSTQRVKKVLDGFPAKQTSLGYFHSQDGEWDSNGQVLWILRKFYEMTRTPPGEKCLGSIDKGGLWISRKRMADAPVSPHAGLLPAGFSAEHLGPNDYYYWDDFWGVAGLDAACYLENLFGNKDRAAHFRDSSDELLRCIRDSLMCAEKRLETQAMPAAPYRRLDSGAVGSLVAGYPLQIFRADDLRLLQTAAYLFDHCFVDGAFFHDMTHSGFNPYLNLHIAQVFLRAKDSRYFEIMKTVARLSSSTGQWPEAVHPATLGGCMGDGQHVWAAAEWILMVRNCFLREEESQKKIILGSGIPREWIATDQELWFGPALTTFGKVSLLIQPEVDHIKVSWEAQWFDTVPVIEIAIPGFTPVVAGSDDRSVVLRREERSCASL